jgi:ribosomal-protein-alanine acetyltransferase
VVVRATVQDEAPTAEAWAAPTDEVGGFARFLSDLKHVFASGKAPPPDGPSQPIIGFVGVWLLPEEAHMVTIAVREDSRGCGVGELLLIAAIEMVTQRQQPVMTLEVRVSNKVAVSLYEKYGFKHMGLRPRYYSDDHEDAYILSVDWLDSPEYRELFQRLKREHAERWGESQFRI